MAGSKALAPLNDESAAKQRALDEMNDALRAEFDAIAEEVRKQAHGNLLFYHKLGGRSAKIHADTAKYGTGAVEKMSAALVIDRALIYKAMTFAAMFDKDRVKALTERKTAGDNYLTWSHVTQLVHVEDKKQVEELIEMIFAQDLSVRGLRAVIVQRLAAGNVSGRVTAPRTVMGGLSQLLTMAGKLNQRFAGDFDDTVFGPLDEIEGAQVTEDMLKRVAESETALTDLAEKAGAKAAEMHQIRGRLQDAARAAAADKEKGEAKPAAKPAAAQPKAAAAKPKAAAAKPKPPKPAKAGKAGRRQRRPVVA